MNRDSRPEADNGHDYHDVPQRKAAHAVDFIISFFYFVVRVLIRCERRVRRFYALLQFVHFPLPTQPHCGERARCAHGFNSKCDFGISMIYPTILNNRTQKVASQPTAC